MKKYNYIYGINTVIETIKAKKYKIDCVFLLNKNNKYLIKLLNSNKIKFLIKDKKELNKFSFNNQGVVAKISDWEFIDINDLIELSLENKKNPLIVMLDKIEDPQNFGSIIRICDMFDVSGIIILNRNQIKMNESVAKVSSGAFNYVPICIVSNLSNAIRKLKNKSFWIYSTLLNEKSQEFNKLNYNSPTVLILGNEGKGISNKISNISDFNIYIKTYGHLDSLNVSSASSILIYEITKKLKDE